MIQVTIVASNEGQANKSDVGQSSKTKPHHFFLLSFQQAFELMTLTFTQTEHN